MYKKYLSGIMKEAWWLFRQGGRTFSDCLKKAWATCKALVAALAKKEEEAKKQAKDYVVRVHYGQYKNEYSHCKTIKGSYDAVTKTIEVLVNQTRRFAWER